MRLILEEQRKCLQSFINNGPYHPMNPNADATYQTVNLFSFDKCFICFISDCPHLMKFVISTSCPHLMKFRNQHNNVCTILVKIDVVDTCGAMIRSNFGIVFMLLFKKKENAVHIFPK